jgi:hypothetical protein
MYRDSVDALLRLIEGIDDEGTPLESSEIASISSVIGTLSNGIRHCSVQILFENGFEYKIEAFGVEADELYARARNHPMNRLVTA